MQQTYRVLIRSIQKTIQKRHLLIYSLETHRFYDLSKNLLSALVLPALVGTRLSNVRSSRQLLQFQLVLGP
jgi:hypothetical protein